jgi:hypothetical protein
VHALGLHLRPVAIGVAKPDGSVVGNFLDERRPSVVAMNRLNQWLLAGVAAALVVAVGIFIGQRIYERSAVERELARLDPEAAAAQQLRVAIEARRPRFEEIVGILSRPDGIDALVALTQAVPDTSWAQSVEIHAPLVGATQLRWMSYTADGGSLVQSLQQSPLLEAVTLVSTLTVAGQPDRLELTAQLRGTSAGGDQGGTQ